MLSDEAKKGGKKKGKKLGCGCLDKCGPLRAQWEPPGFICLCDIFPAPIKLLTDLSWILNFWLYAEQIDEGAGS